VILSRCLHIGTQIVDKGVLTGMVMHPTFQRVTKSFIDDCRRKNIPVLIPKYLQPLSPELFASSRSSSEYFKTMSLIAYWTGDLYPTRDVVGPPVDAASALLCCTSFIANRGGKSGVATLASGRVGVGLVSPPMGRILEALAVIWGLTEAYNIYGLTETVLAIYVRSRLKFRYSTVYHNFVIPGTNLLGASRYPIDGRPSLYFDYDSMDSRIKLAPSADKKVRNQQLFDLVAVWAHTYFKHPHDIWVGEMILPYGSDVVGHTHEIKRLSTLHVCTISSSLLGRGIFSPGEIRIGHGVQGATITDLGNLLDLEGDRIADHLSDKGVRVGSIIPPCYTPSRWGDLMVQDTFALSGFLLKQPIFRNVLYMDLLPPFKEVEMFQVDHGDWTMFTSASDDDVSFESPSALKDLAMTYDRDGNPIISESADFSQTYAPDVVDLNNVSNLFG